MKKIFIIFLFIIFSSSFSLANNNEKITVEEIENIFFPKIKSDEEQILSLIDDISSIKIPNSSSFYQPIPRNACVYNTVEDNYDCKKKNKGKSLSNKQYIDLLHKQRKPDWMWYGQISGFDLGESEEIRLFIKKYSVSKNSPTFLLRKKYYEKRQQYRGIAKCMYDDGPYGGVDNAKRCNAKVLRVVFTRSEEYTKKRPGDIFYALDAINRLVFISKDKDHHLKTFFHYEGKKISSYFKNHKAMPGMVCGETNTLRNYNGWRIRTYRKCHAFKKSTYKKLEKLKKDPSNEKVLGHKLIKYIKNVRMIRSIEEKLGTRNYSLLGDMLNATVVDVEKNIISPDLQKRRALLKKYSLILRGIKKKLDEDNYKSIDKDVSKLSKTFKNLKTLTSTNEMALNIDEAVDNIFDTNKLIQKSVLNSKDSEEEKLLALSSIYFMQSLIDSILSTIPEKYYVETKELSRDLFNDDELETLEVIIDTMVNKNKKIKSAELTKSMDIINKYINTSDVLNTLDNLGMKNSINRTFTQNTAAEIVQQEIRDNLDKEILREARKLLQEIDKNELSDLTKEASNIASEVASDPSLKESFSILDKKFGNFTLKQLIGVCRSRGNC